MKTFLQNKKVAVVVTSLLVLIALAILAVVFMLVQKTPATQTNQTENMQVEADDGEIILELEKPASNDLKAGDLITVNLLTRGSKSSAVAEIVLNYPQELLEATEISESSTVLSLNKSIDNEKGVITVDLAHSGPGNFENDQILADFKFTVLKAGKAAIVEVSEESTLGYPSTLSTTGFGSLNIDL
jgi:uncharacterized membrane protein YvbJ